MVSRAIVSQEVSSNFLTGTKFVGYQAGIAASQSWQILLEKIRWKMCAVGFRWQLEALGETLCLSMYSP